LYSPFVFLFNYTIEPTKWQTLLSQGGNSQYEKLYPQMAQIFNAFSA